MIRALFGSPQPMRFRCYEVDHDTDMVLTCDSHSLKVRIHAADEFLREALSSKCGRYFAYDGGRYQVQSILLNALDSGLYVEGSFWGGIASRVYVYGNDRVVQFLDSSSLLRDPLEEACEWADIQIKDSPASRVLSLTRLLVIAQRFLASIGSSFRPTLAGAAFEIFRRLFLKEDFETDSNLNKRTRKALYGGRVEPFRSHFRSNVRTKFKLDMCSSYGAAMVRGPIPGHIDKVSTERARNSISHVRVKVPPCYFPPLPHRLGENGAVYYPTGIFEGWYHESAIKWAEEHGAEVEEVFHSIHFKDWHAPGAFAAALYEKREASKNRLERKLLKGLIQSVAGRLGMRTGFERLVCNPKEKKCPHDGEHDTKFGPACFRPIRAGVYIVKDPEIPAASSHVPAAAAINAIALCALNDGCQNVLSRGEQIGYVDTDRVDATTREGFSIGTGLGQWRVDKEFQEAEYLSGKWLRTDDEVTAAGIPNATIDDWQALLRGAESERWDRSTIKETLTAGHVYEAFRSWHLRRMCAQCHQEIAGEQCRNHPWAAMSLADARPRRIVKPDGNTEPWDVEALKAPWRKIGSDTLTVQYRKA